MAQDKKGSGEFMIEEINLFGDSELISEHKQKRYGLPYQGNKSRIADYIVGLLPSGKRLVDLFGGGVNNYMCYVKREMGRIFIQRFESAYHSISNERHKRQI